MVIAAPTPASRMADEYFLPMSIAIIPIVIVIGALNIPSEEIVSR